MVFLPFSSFAVQAYPFGLLSFIYTKEEGIRIPNNCFVKEEDLDKMTSFVRRYEDEACL